MALARIKNWIVETLTATDLNAEFNNIVNYINGTTMLTLGTTTMVFGDTKTSVTGLSIASGSANTGRFAGIVTAGSAGFQTGNGRLVANNTASVANGGTMTLDTGANGGAFSGLLSVVNSTSSNANVRTATVYSVVGRATTIDAADAQSSANGSGGAATFTVTMASAGIFIITNTSGAAADISASFTGTVG